MAKTAQKLVLLQLPEDIPREAVHICGEQLTASVHGLCQLAASIPASEPLHWHYFIFCYIVILANKIL
ncbi:hypothetical protein P4S72_07720 [Vibrio sp. PP-XX7]